MLQNLLILLQSWFSILMELLYYLHIIFRDQGSFPSQVTQEPLIIDRLQTSNNVSNLREKCEQVLK